MGDAVPWTQQEARTWVGALRDMGKRAAPGWRGSCWLVTGRVACPGLVYQPTRHAGPSVCKPLQWSVPTGGATPSPRTQDDRQAHAMGMAKVTRHLPVYPRPPHLGLAGRQPHNSNLHAPFPYAFHAPPSHPYAALFEYPAPRPSLPLLGVFQPARLHQCSRFVCCVASGGRLTRETATPDLLRLAALMLALGLSPPVTRGVAGYAVERSGRWRQMPPPGRPMSATPLHRPCMQVDSHIRWTRTCQT